MKKLHVGQKVWVVSFKQRRNDTESIEEKTVSKVGKKYFELSDSYFGRFYIDTLMHDAGQYSSRYQVFLDIEKYNSEVEADRLIAKIRKYFDWFNQIKLSLDQLKQIDSIITTESK